MSSDIKTDLGTSNKEIPEEGPAQGRSLLTYVLITVAIIILLYIVYSKWLVHQPFYSGKENEKEKDPDSDSDDEEEKPKKRKYKVEEPDDDWSVKNEVQKIEDIQEKLIRQKKAEE